ncbi:hypothetical protein ABZ260_23060 [Streptosporangium sp. NPDC006013]|uniref:hypothetical protein n=1 Tax=Streptosporangium sp. NPDC006013 TaxID=3155596 RepID=UPI0033BA955C
MSGIEDLENSEPGDRRIGGRPLTARELRAILDVEPEDLRRRHRAQEQDFKPLSPQL